ncbi:MAG: nuclear transport factor 2 family protein [Candidatus Krumholzibacteriota bacterium]
MKRIPVLVLVFWVVSMAAGCEKVVDVEAEKIELLRIHLTDIRAHKDNDVPALMQTIPEEFIHVGDGKVGRRSREEIRDFFTGYLDGAEYERYEDLQVPHAEVSRDGTMGWVISQMAVTRTEHDGAGGRQARSFTYAGIMTYEKIRGKWIKVANVSTFKR